MAFEILTWEPVTIEHVNLRDEKHGEDTVSAMDIKVTLKISNNRLDTLIHPKLRKSNYFDRELDGGQVRLDDGQPELLPNLMFPEMHQPIKWPGLELTNTRVVFDYGMGEERGSNIDLHSCKVKSFFLTLMEGGTVEITFTIQNNEFPDGVLDKLRRKLSQDLPLLLIPTGAVCKLVKAIPEKKEPPKEKAPRADAGKVVSMFQTPEDAASDTPPIDAAQRVITAAMESAAPASGDPADAPKARGSRGAPTNLE